MRVTLDGGQAPKTPPRRLGGAACAMRLVSDGRETLCPEREEDRHEDQLPPDVHGHDVI